MRANMNKLTAPEMTLARLLVALESELLGASDEEVLEAARDLGMDPGMKGSAASAGLKYFSQPRLSDFFELDLCTRLPGQMGDSATVEGLCDDGDIPQAKPAVGPGGGAPTAAAAADLGVKIPPGRSE